MKVTNIETLREETMRALNEEFGLDLAPIAIEYKFISLNGQTYDLKYECALDNMVLRRPFTIIFTDDYVFFRYDGENHSHIDYHDLKNKAQYFIRLAVIVHELINY